MMIDFQVRLIQFPNNMVKETVVSNEDGSYTIFIDASLSREEQRERFCHAMRHILGDDFSKYDVDKIEFVAHSA